MQGSVIEVFANEFLPRMFYGYKLHLTCKELWHKSVQYNLICRFFSLSPEKCSATYYISQCYPRIDSTIPYVKLTKICVLGRVSKLTDIHLNDVCAVGNLPDVMEYFLSLLSVGISFYKLTIYPAKSFRAKGRKQYIHLGYSKFVDISTANVVRFH